MFYENVQIFNQNKIIINKIKIKSNMYLALQSWLLAWCKFSSWWSPDRSTVQGFQKCTDRTAGLNELIIVMDNAYPCLSLRVHESHCACDSTGALVWFEPHIILSLIFSQPFSISDIYSIIYTHEQYWHDNYR